MGSGEGVAGTNVAGIGEVAVGVGAEVTAATEAVLLAGGGVGETCTPHPTRGHRFNAARKRSSHALFTGISSSNQATTELERIQRKRVIPLPVIVERIIPQRPLCAKAGLPNEGGHVVQAIWRLTSRML